MYKLNEFLIDRWEDNRNRNNNNNNNRICHCHCDQIAERQVHRLHRPRRASRSFNGFRVWHRRWLDEPFRRCSRRSSNLAMPLIRSITTRIDASICSSSMIKTRTGSINFSHHRLLNQFNYLIDEITNWQVEIFPWSQNSRRLGRSRWTGRIPRIIGDSVVGIGRRCLNGRLPQCHQSRPVIFCFFFLNIWKLNEIEEKNEFVWWQIVQTGFCSDTSEHAWRGRGLQIRHLSTEIWRRA